MKSLKELQAIVNDAINSQNFKLEPYGLYEPIEYVLSIGGKRLRPVMVLMSCSLFTDDYSPALMPALGLEIFHNFTLLHDDIMDKSVLRRKQPTVHTKWNDNTAILSGDAMSIIAYKYVAKCPEHTMPEVFDVFSQTALEVCEGQQYDMDFESCVNVTAPEYIRMIELKTSVLIACCLKIGAIIGGASKKDIENLYMFGKYIGLAFQLQDDYLDVYGNPKVFGKNIGGDITSNKKTYLLIKALELAKGETLERLNSQIAATRFDPEEKIRKVTEIYNELDLQNISKNKMLEFHSIALQYFDKVDVSTGRKAELRKLADLLLERIN